MSGASVPRLRLLGEFWYSDGGLVITHCFYQNVLLFRLDLDRVFSLHGITMRPAKGVLRVDALIDVRELGTSGLL